MQNSKANPSVTVRLLQDQAERIETLSHEGTLVWHRWPSAASDGPPIILFHGGFGSWTHWFNVIDLLRKKAPVIAVDLPGLGDSDDVSLPHTPEKLADVLIQGLEQLLPSDQGFHLVGFSFGGMLGSLVAAAFGERCLTFTAVGASGFGDLHYIVKGIERTTADMPVAEAEKITRRNLSLLMFANPDSIDALSLHIHSSNVARGRIRSRRMSVSDRLLQALPVIKARIGGIWGERDATGGGLEAILKRADIFRTYQPDAPFDVIDGGGHWIMQECPEAFASALLRQLNLD